LPSSSRRSKGKDRRDSYAADPVTAYAEDVVAGRIVAGPLVRKACERHLHDLETAEERGLIWSVADALRPVEFAQFCKHSKGRWAGKPVTLEPWQVFIVGSLFGWLRYDDDGNLVRRYRKAFIAVARKNGKSTLLAVIALYLMIADGEAGAEIYAAATKLDQAKIVWEESERMVKKSDDLSEIIQRRRNRMFVEETESKYLPLGMDSDKLDGLNPHGAIVDEVHAHKDGAIVEVIDSGMGARAQPLLVEITTSGFHADWFGHQEWEYYAAILNGVYQNDSLFGYIATLDDDDDPFDESCWIKANPNLGVSVSLKYLREQAEAATQAPHKRNNFLCKHMNLWVSADEVWMAVEKWDASAGDLVELLKLTGRSCVIGLDLSSKIDLCALVLIFLPTEEDPVYRILPFFWTPEETLEEREKRDKAPYQRWVDEGYLQTTPGSVIDQDIIEAAILALRKQVNILEVAFDPWNAMQLAVKLQDAGLTCVEIRQGARTLSEPMKELGALVYAKKVVHGGHPVLRWNLMNTKAKQDDNENIRPVKPKDKTKRIDGIAAAVTAMSRVIVLRPKPTSTERVEKEANGRRIKVW
jgi:phage terminase large subunit-like protein